MSLPSRERGLKSHDGDARLRQHMSLPSRERGLKWRRHVHDHRSLHVAPFTGAWIEIAYWQVAGMPKEVAPFTGAWIEIVNGRTISPFWLVAPFTGAWIEIDWTVLWVPVDGSLPSRERGLKYIAGELVDDAAVVAPFTGAWIEIALQPPT